MTSSCSKTVLCGEQVVDLGAYFMHQERPTKRFFSNQDLVRLIIPLVFEQILAIFVGMADTVMVSSVSEAAVSAVSLVDNINVLLINVFAALATGGAVVIGQYLGRKERWQACRASDQLYLFVTAFSVVVMAALYLCKPFILNHVFGEIEPDVRAYSETYLLITAASIPFIAIYNSGAAVFRAMGNAKISLVTSLIMNAVNIAGNAVLIYGLKMEVAGAAIPTLFSRILAAVLITLLLRNQHLLVHLTRPFQLRPDFGMIRLILRLGVPNGLENSVFQLGKILVLNLVAVFGTASIAANAVANSLTSFQVLPGMAIGLALLTVIARCVGAGDYEQARYYNRKLMLISYGLILVSNVLFYFLLPLALQMYHLTPETTVLARKVILLHGGCSIVIWSASFTLPNTLRAAGDVKYTMVISLLSMWIWRVAFSYVLGQWLDLGLVGIWIAMIIDWAVRAVFFLWRYWRRKWEKIKVIEN